MIGEREDAYHVRLKGRNSPLLPKHFQVYMLSEERVFPNLVCALASQSRGRITSEKTFQNMFRLRAEDIASSERIANDFLVHLVGIFCEGMSGEHTTEETRGRRKRRRRDVPSKKGGNPLTISNNKIPSVHQSIAFVYACPRIISGLRYSGVPQKSGGSLIACHIEFAEPKVTEREMACPVEKDVLRFQIPEAGLAIDASKE